MNIQPIVEGYGEVHAVPILLRRLRDECEAFGIDVNRPIRATRSQLVREDTLKQRVNLALLQEHCGAIVIIFDADDDCPGELGPIIQRWLMKSQGWFPAPPSLRTANTRLGSWRQSNRSEGEEVFEMTPYHIRIQRARERPSTHLRNA